MRELRRKVLVPAFTLTEECKAGDVLASRRVIKRWKGREPLVYFERPVTNPLDKTGVNYNLFPIILDRNSAPWDLGNLYILSRLEGVTQPSMATYHSLADDLGAFKEWIDDHENAEQLIFDFPKFRLRRVTYRYRGALNLKIASGEIAASTGNRRMGTVVSFYRWLIDEEFFEPEAPPWQERTFNLSLKDAAGFAIKKAIKSTDLHNPAPKVVDLLTDTIQDGGKLRPLPESEQRWVMEAADGLGNPEMFLFLLFMMLSGARIQTAGTLRLRHFIQPRVAFSKALAGDGEVFKLKVGPGTGIDSKHDKTMVLQMPRFFYEALHTYAVSSRAKRRRDLAPGGDHLNQYLFITQQGSPYYTSKEDALRFDPNFSRRHTKTGGTVRQFLTDHLIPKVRANNDPNFHFRIHDLRATFGMNQTDIQMALVESKVITLGKAKSNVMALMGHASPVTTELYLDYRKQMEVMYCAVNGYGDQVAKWTNAALKGVMDV